MGNEIRKGIYWEEEEKRTCMLCERKGETWEHIWEECREWAEGVGSWQEAVSWILGEEGEGWMRELERVRREKGVGEIREERSE